MNKTTKILLICVLCAVLVSAAVSVAVVVSKTSVPNAKEYAAQFDAARADYDAAVAFLERLTQKAPTAPVTVSIPTMGEDDAVYFFRENEKQRVVTLTVKPEERASLDGVARAFSRCGFEFKNARIENGNVTFTAADDAYFVIYSAADEKPAAVDGMKVKALDACWYQMIRAEK